MDTLSILTWVGSLIAAVLAQYYFDRLRGWFKIKRNLWRRRYILPLTNLAAQKEVYVRPSLDVITGGRHPQSIRGYTHSAEAIAVQKISALFDKLPVELRFDYNSTITGENLCWILIGISNRTKITQSFYDRMEAAGMRVCIQEGRHQFFLDVTGKTYCCKHIFDAEFVTKVSKDYGVIYRGVSDNGTAVIVCGGIHMFGTLAAVEVLLSEPFIHRVTTARSREYIQLVEVSVREDGLNIDHDSISWKDLPFYAISTDSRCTEFKNLLTQRLA